VNFRIPIYVEETRGEANATSFLVRPLFFTGPERRNEKLNRALTRLASDIRKVLHDLAASADHAPLSQWSYSPELHDQWLETRLELKRGRSLCRMLVVSFAAFERRIAFTPGVPELFFEILRGQDVKERATEVLTRHFRDVERDSETPLAAELGAAGKAWLTFLELNIVIPAEPKAKPKPSPFAFLGGGEILSGAQELERVGRCLSFLYPDDLDRAVLREAEVSELHALLTAKDRRPVLLVGPRQSGKTAIVHEVVWRTVDARKQKYAARNNVWLIAPPRLISGMSYVGQWENRLLAILKEAHERDHVLYFDDLPGLFFAGQSAGSDLSVADVLKPRLEKRECRVVAEITPEALRVIRERDRSFADLFHIVPVQEPPERDTVSILIAVQRQLEEQHGCQFHVDVVPIVCDLQRRYASDLAFPGKAAGFLRQLAVKFQKCAINPIDALQEFQAKTGLTPGMLTWQTRFRRQAVRLQLKAEIVGQDEAVEAMTGVVTLAAARLNDPARPLASLLFLGPTGVGKTQCAKALARLLFGDASRLVRFDMNEFLSPASVARLVGTIQEPEGLLTSAVRRQPFCVLLLDEIEKAHPDVFDLLLAVLGEGRLTDALGRTANFTNAIIVLTSNLGAREARSRLGFHASVPPASRRHSENRQQDAGGTLMAEDAAASIYVEAAEKFFRPEFFNRLDRVVPFTALSRDEIQRIALHVFGDLFHRDGLRQRQCAIQIHPAAMSLLVEQGYHPQLGARALKRVIERQLAQPLAVKLAELTPGTPTLVTLFPRAGEIVPHIEPLVTAPARGVARLKVSESERDDLLDRIEQALVRLESEMEAMAPSGRVALDDVSPEHARYFAVSEQLRLVRRMFQQMTSAGPTRGDAPVRASRPRVPARRALVRFTNAGLRQQQLAADSFRASLHDLETVPHASGPAERLLDCLHELALAEVMARATEADARVALLLVMTDATRTWAISATQRKSLREMFGRLWGYEVKEVETPKEFHEFGRDRVFALEIEGPGARTVAEVEAGTHLFLPSFGNIVLTAGNVLPLAPNENAAERIGALQRRCDEWIDALAAGRATLADDPWPFGPLIRISQEGGKTMDLRSGFAVQGEPNADELRTMVLSQLPAPQEFLSGTE